MPCEWYKMADGTVMHINRGRSRKKLQCKFCKATYTEGKLCDFPIGNGKTCDAQMCNRCAITVGLQEADIGHGMKRIGDTVDLCPIHKSSKLPQTETK